LTDNISNPHDKLFREIWSDREIINILEQTLSEEGRKMGMTAADLTALYIYFT